MLPNDEKSPAVGSNPQFEAGRGSMGSLQNPLHELYSQSVKDAAAQGLGHPQASASGAVPTVPLSATSSQPATAAAPSAPIIAGSNHAPSVAPTNEEVWVEKTKAVIEQTLNDPYGRAQALQELRAAYQAEYFRKNGVDGS
jgi:hypothetical protein